MERSWEWSVFKLMGTFWNGNPIRTYFLILVLKKCEMGYFESMGCRWTVLECSPAFKWKEVENEMVLESGVFILIGTFWVWNPMHIVPFLSG